MTPDLLLLVVVSLRTELVDGEHVLDDDVVDELGVGVVVELVVGVEVVILLLLGIG